MDENKLKQFFEGELPDKEEQEVKEELLKNSGQTPDSRMYRAFAVYRKKYGNPRSKKISILKIAAAVVVILLMVVIAIQPLNPPDRLLHWEDMNSIEKIGVLSFLEWKKINKEERQKLTSLLESEKDINVKLLIITAMHHFPAKPDPEYIRELHAREHAPVIKSSLYALLQASE